MNYVTVMLHFELDGMRINESLAGNRQEIVFAEHTCALVLPSERSDFGVNRSLNYLSSISPVSWRGETLVSYSVNMLRIEVRVDSYLTVDHLPSGGPHDQVDVEEARRVFDEAAPIALELTRRYVDQVRVNSCQHWLGSSSFVPRCVWINEMRDASGRRLAVDFHDVGPVVLVGDDDALTIAGHRTAIDNACRSAEPRLAESLLADAHFANWPTGSPDRRQAVLLAAIACEVKIKERLRELAGTEQRALVALVLENPRDVSLAAASLLDKALHAVCGRSLLREDRELYRAAVRLFEDRNSIAHRGGAELDSEQLSRHVATAQSVFAYLDSISPVAS